MKHVTDQMLAEAINASKAEFFDTHEIEQRVLRLHAVAFARQILEHQHNDDVLQQFSASFSKRIGDAFPEKVKPDQKVRSNNLAGRECDNQQWHRLVATVHPC